MENQEDEIVNSPSNNIPTSPSVNNPIVSDPTTRTYTQITNATCDFLTVKILKKLMSSNISEFTDVSRYSYQHLITINANRELSEALEQIALNEMIHMELLGKAIVSFCGVPKYTNGQGTYWSARFVDYSTNIQSFLRANISAEQRAISEYEQAIQRVNNESLKRLFREIIEDERRHIEIFKSFQE